MNRHTFITVAVSLLSALGACAEQKAYDLKLKWNASEGQKYQKSSTETEKMALKIVVNDEVVQEQDGEKTTVFEMTVEVLAAKDGEPTKTRVAFGDAYQDAGEETKKFGFAGKTVVAAEGEEGWTYTYEDGGKVSEEDAAGLKKALNHEKKKGEKSATEVFAPKQPVKVGDRWEPNLEDAVAAFSSDETGFDVEKSSATFTLLSAEERDGKPWGKIEGKVKLAATTMGPATLAEPLILEMTLTFDTVLDGSLPDGEMSATMQVKGKRDAEMPNGQALVMDIDMSMKGKETRKLVK